MYRLASILLRTLCGDSLAKVMVRDYDGIPLLLRYVVTLLRLHINYLPSRFANNKLFNTDHANVSI